MSNYNSKNFDTNKNDSEKKKLTLKVVNDGLTKEAKRVLLNCFLANLLILFFCSIFLIDTEYHFNEVWTRIVRILAVGIPLLFALVSVLRYFFEIRRIKLGEYIVVTDTVDFSVGTDRRKREFFYRRGEGYYSYEHAIYFKKTGRVLVTYKKTKKYEPNEILYLVVRKNKPKKPILIYREKYYDLDESFCSVK